MSVEGRDVLWQPCTDLSIEDSTYRPSTELPPSWVPWVAPVNLVESEFPPPTMDFDEIEEGFMWVQDEDSVECMTRYRHGGFHPIHINEVYSYCPDAPDRGRYRILHKLGRGAYSTVWFAQDLSRPKWVPLRIQCM